MTNMFAAIFSYFKPTLSAKVSAYRQRRETQMEVSTLPVTVLSSGLGHLGASVAFAQLMADFRLLMRNASSWKRYRGMGKSSSG